MKRGALPLAPPGEARRVLTPRSLRSAARFARGDRCRVDPDPVFKFVVSKRAREAVESVPCDPPEQELPLF